MKSLLANTSFLQPRYIPFWLALAACLTSFVSSPMALAIGFFFAVTGLVPEDISLATYTKKLLSYSIIGLGFGIPFDQALAVTSDGIGLIIASIFGTLILGWIATRAIKLDTTTGYLISAGTAICGGSAIAAISPAINAKDDQIGISLATVFLLNSIALFIFPVIGNTLGLDQHTFGVWAAIAIHDTSSVVGAAGAYGEEALTTATTLKLARALWIIPLTLISAAIFARINSKNGNGGHTNTIAIPWFILWYCLAIATAELLPQFDMAYQGIFAIAKKSLVVCLFLIGSNISVTKLRQAGPKPLLLGVGLWMIISISSLLWLTYS